MHKNCSFTLNWKDNAASMEGVELLKRRFQVDDQRSNPILAKLFRMVKLAENAGFGFDKIEENWKAYNSTVPEYLIEFDSVVVDFKMANESKLGDKLGDNQLKILSEIEKDNTVSITILSKNIGISTTAVENNISKLRNLGYLKRVGSAKSGHWDILR